MVSKDGLIAELGQLAGSMVQGSLSEVTRQCGDSSCACARDPTRRHGPHLYLKFSAQGKAHCVYVPPDHASALRESHQAWLRFQQLGAELGAANRERFLRSLDRDKRLMRARRAKARGKTSR